MNSGQRNGPRLTEIIGQLGKLVYVLAGVATVGDAEAEVEVEVLQEAFPEVVPLDHSEAVHRLLAHGELHTDEERDGETDTHRERLRSRRRSTEKLLQVAFYATWLSRAKTMGSGSQHQPGGR